MKHEKSLLVAVAIYIYFGASPALAGQALKKYGLDPDKPNPATI